MSLQQKTCVALDLIWDANTTQRMHTLVSVIESQPEVFLRLESDHENAVGVWQRNSHLTFKNINLLNLWKSKDKWCAYD